MKNCHVCNQLCEDNAELCPICGAMLLDEDVVEESESENSEEERKIEPTQTEIKGLIIAILSVVVVSIPLIYCIIPGLPFSGLLLYLIAAIIMPRSTEF